ncbi:MAG: glutamate-1-semialdehyde 2,1-aminomutase [Candidatus Hydrogenedentota bacterium]
MRELKKSERIFVQSTESFPGGVNSPVRSFNAVKSMPPVIYKAKGPYVYDVDGNKYIDYVCSFGPMILGHLDKSVVKSINKILLKGMSFGAITPYELELAKLVREAFPSMERMRFVNSGTEATMSAIRLARGYTGKDYIIKFEGCYHGHSDSLLVKAGSGSMTFSIPSSHGVPFDLARYTLTAQFNDISSVERLFHQFKNKIACIIVEPIPANMGVIKPDINFLVFLRQITKENKSLLIFDEVITGFRLCFGGAQKFYKIEPDITTLGKILGGGLPIGCYGGKKYIMEKIAPEGPVYQAGTLSGNPIVMASGIATLTKLKDKKIYKILESRGRLLEKNIIKTCKRYRIPVSFNRVGSLFTLFFNDRPVIDYKTALKSDTNLYAEFFRMLLKKGVYLAPSQFEAGFISLAHTDSIINKTCKIFNEVILILNSKLQVAN